MGVTTNGILAYGYNLGGDDSGWEIEQAGEFGDWEPPWPNHDPTADPDAQDEDEDRDLPEDARSALLTAAGFTETDREAQGYWDRHRDAEQRVGVELITYASPQYPLYVLAAHSITAHRGYFETIDFPALELQRVAEGWDTKLVSALDVLGMTPRQQSPAWLLLSYWSGYP